ncbi:uncharacterized protein KY384_005790 [Bacidia gigantensis]|uniref:uncharacterized protein n=1 Tax=Bacidia gigantensis TaxID=2732470 RepID=UPI001D04E18F|nr:uncharacterized protein KY384_005790 [Bacidia gigantensis]KAG8529155.1 hypothetical protein KY384_005790 [Bacidia gigantensis]
MTAYSITSNFLSDGNCITTSGAPSTLSSPYTVLSPTTVAETDFPSYAGSQFRDFLGFSTCFGGGELIAPTPIAPVATPTMLYNDSNPSSSQNLSDMRPQISSNSQITKSSSTSRLAKPAGIGVGIAVPSAIILILLISAFVFRNFRRRRLRRKNEMSKSEKSPLADNTQAYLQQKPELEAEEQQRHELDGQQKFHELDGVEEVQEAPAGATEQRAALVRTRQELRGVEHSQELDTTKTRV